MSKTQIDSIISRLEKLEAKVFSSEKIQQKKGKSSNKASLDIDFSINERAFVNRYIAGKSGPQKFTLLLAYLAKGKIDKPITIARLKNAWSKMSGKRLLGQYNDFYPTEAKNKGWVDTPKRGYYTLSNEWENSYAKQSKDN